MAKQGCCKIGGITGLAPARALPPHISTPCHYISRDRHPPDNGVQSRKNGTGALRCVVARGRVGSGWALAGTLSGGQVTRSPHALSGFPILQQPWAAKVKN